MNIYFLKYNNYFNRTFRREDSLINYLAYEVGRTVDVKLFTPGDGVNTSVIANIDLKAAGTSPDYAIVQNDQGDIESRWFVMECRQLRRDQFRVELRRDLIVDSFDSLESCERFWCDRGLVEDSNNLILQPENISVNRIKKKETLIKDNSGLAWIVGYLNRNISSSITVNGSSTIIPTKTEDTTFAAWEYNQYTTNWFNGYTDETWFSLYWHKQRFLDYWIRSWDIKRSEVKMNSDYTGAAIGYHSNTSYPNDNFPSTEEVTNAFSINTWTTDILSNFNINTQTNTKTFTDLDGQIIKFTDGFYRIKINNESYTFEETLNKSEIVSKATIIDNICKNTLKGNLDDIEFNKPVCTFHATGTRYKIVAEKIEDKGEFNYTIPVDHPHLNDAPYDMFCFPYGAYENLGSEEFYLKAATALITETNVSTNSYVYDLQLLPFQPNLATTTTSITDKDNNTIGKIYWATSSTFSKTILLNEPIGVENPKLDSIINLYRLVSPNYSGQFEFTAAANGGISGVIINATYLPINPYIRIAPLFGRLYGQEFEDARGLICSGDFSLPAVNSAWVQYQQNNKTYQATFDRSIANLEFTNNINRQMDRISAVVGALQGGAQGSASGMTFGPLGAAIGAGVGTLAAGIGGEADIRLNEQMRQEQLSYIKDQQRLNIAAIQAQPYSLAKTTAFTANNKIFPMLEYYSCNEEEKQAVISYLINNSFSIGAVIPFKTLLVKTWAADNKTARRWIQGHPIEINSNEDYHYTAELGRELAQGYYFEHWEEQ